MKAFDQELVSGSILRSVWKLSWPIVLLNLINGVHGLIDQILIGHYVQEHEANAAIGIAWNLFLVVVVMLSSLFTGMSVLLAQSTGAKDRKALAHILNTAVTTTVYIVLFVLAPIGYFVCPLLLPLVNATDLVQHHALPYLRVMFVCSLPLSLNFLLTGAMQASGDTKTPLLLVLITTALNASLSILLITGAGPLPAMGTAGAALGTCIAPIPAVVIAFWLIIRKKTILSLPEKIEFVPDFELLGRILSIGIPTAIHAVVLNVGGIWLYRYIGSLAFGDEAQAAYTICYAQLFSFVTWAALGLRGASAALMGQNIGAGDSERGRQGVRVAAVLGGIWASIWGMAAWTASGPLLAIFDVADQHVMDFGATLLRYLAVSGIFLAVALALTGGLIGAGETKKPMVIAIITQIIVLLGVCEIFSRLGMLTASAVWLSILISHFSRYVLTHFAFHYTEVKSMVLEPSAAAPE